MAHDNQDRIMALAGIYQAINCVVRIAHQGTADTEAMEPCIYSLFQVDATSVEAVYGEPGAVVNGARQIVAQLLGQPERNLELTRYVIQVIRLERHLSRRPDMLARIGQGIDEAGTKREHFALLHPSLIAHFADLYSNTLSQLSPRIIIRGDQLHLRNPDNQSRLRALLLAAVRSAMLWRQVGGRRLQLLFKNRQMLEDARHYIDATAA
ncbi:high frequency lysogenization protein HflD [Thiorhodococcus mannitoliphagus]|uniref:High frequency lysogenization protein HflD homolog n=1 Tax=Thiorhodococcus mannitoliphagus TaxID=329406 RepID=A0A6P1DTE7_9GAMM|nr:high frequency lysogenization protein HflD [Thiorhodococcus mannitoliphagus]NEX18985.1 high frequency lysogenization protein HflD [Thiorhodococcus mannitoliphagus]